MFISEPPPEGSMIAITTTPATNTNERPHELEAVDVERGLTIAAPALEASTLQTSTLGMVYMSVVLIKAMAQCQSCTESQLSQLIQQVSP